MVLRLVRLASVTIDTVRNMLEIVSAIIRSQITTTTASGKSAAATTLIGCVVQRSPRSFRASTTLVTRKPETPNPNSVTDPQLSPAIARRLLSKSSNPSESASKIPATRYYLRPCSNTTYKRTGELMTCTSCMEIKNAVLVWTRDL